MYLKIKGEDTRYDVTVMPFTSQHGHKGVQFIGEDIPDTDKGFIVYNDDGSVLSDLSEYTYRYAANQYTVAEDIPEYPTGSDAPLQPSAIDRLSGRISRLSSQVQDITPYTDSKMAYYGESEKVFYGVPEGNTSVFFDRYNGGYEVSRIADRLTVTFSDAIIEATNVTIMIQ